MLVATWIPSLDPVATCCAFPLAKMFLLGVLLSSLMEGNVHAFLLEWGIPLDNPAAPGRWCYFHEFSHCPRRISMASAAHNQALK